MAFLLEPRLALRPGQRPCSNRKLMLLFLPLMLEKLMQMIVGMADTFLVSFLGEAAVSGISLDVTIYTVYVFLFASLAVGGSVVVAQYVGSGQRENADAAASQLWQLCLGFGLFCMGITLAGGNWMLEMLYGNVEPEVMAVCRDYLAIIAYSFPALAIYNAGASIYRSIGNSRTPMQLLLAMNLLNILGGCIVIFVLELGVAGIAWASTLSWTAAALGMSALCLKKSNPAAISLQGVLAWRQDIVRRILGISVPNLLENGTFQATKVALGALIATLGTVQIAANGIGQTLWNFSSIIGMAMAPAFTTLVGQSMGARNVELADYYMQKLTRLTFWLAMAWNLSTIAATPWLLGFYQVSDEVKELVFLTVLVRNIWSCFVQVPAQSLPDGLRAAGDVKYPLYASMFCTCFVRFATAYACCIWLGLGVMGIVMALGMDWTVKAALIVRRYRQGMWKRMRVI